MTATAFQGPLVSIGQQPSVGGVTPDYNPEAGPSLLYDGCAILDPRFGYNAKSIGGYNGLGFTGATNIPVLDVVPYTKTAGAIAAAANVTSGTAMTLVSSSGTGVTVLAAATQVFPSGTVVPANSLAIGGASGVIAFGNANERGGYAVGIYDPSKALARAVSITGVSGGSGGHFIVAGYDLYGYPMTENINATSGATTTNGAKAWKYITSVTPQFTDAHNYSVDTTDIIGLPLRADYFGDLKINYPDTLITATTGFTAAVTTTASSTTGDVRGTYALQVASNNSDHLQIFVTPRPTNLASSAITGLFGVTQA